MGKTAIQGLKQSLQSINERYELKGDADWLMNEVLDLVENSLEKEKEQIIDAVEFGLFNMHTTIDGKKYYQMKY
jgi:hypothetical protein